MTMAETLFNLIQIVMRNKNKILSISIMSDDTSKEYKIVWQRDCSTH